MATPSSILAGESQGQEEPGGLQSMGSQRVGHDWATKQQDLLTEDGHSFWLFIMRDVPRSVVLQNVPQSGFVVLGMATDSSILAWRIHAQRRLVGYSPWSHKELDRTEPLTLSPLLMLYLSITFLATIQMWYIKVIVYFFLTASL